jgi:hypothetical protein
MIIKAVVDLFHLAGEQIISSKNSSTINYGMVTKQSDRKSKIVNRAFRELTESNPCQPAGGLVLKSKTCPQPWALCPLPYATFQANL